ncbi:MAG: ABC transporter ATP-binding protein [Chloroflexota bacterium]
MLHRWPGTKPLLATGVAFSAACATLHYLEGITTMNNAPTIVQNGTPNGTAQSEAPPMIEVRGVTKRFGDTEVVRDLTFDVRQGEIFGFIGPSGSGKTTTIRLLTGVYEPSEGQVLVMGKIPSHPSSQVQERFGYMPQLFVLYPNLTVWENLNFAASIYGLSPRVRRRRIKEMLDFVELSDARNRVAANVSGGMQRRIELAASLVHDPPLLFVDEPTAGIDPVLRGKFWDEFRRLRDEGRTIFVTTQYVGESEYCDRVGVIRNGRIIAVDTPLGLRRLALGGDVVDIMSNDFTAAAVYNLSQLPVVREVRPSSRTEVRVYVEEAASAIPILLEAMNTNNCSISRIEELKPSFDEVFIELMNRDALATGEGEAGEGSA